MRITLCYPPLLPGRKPKYGLQPLGVLYIAAVLREDGHDVQVLDGDIDGLTIEEATRQILAGEPDLVGLSLMTPQLVPALEIAAGLKRARPTLPIVLGGAHIDSTTDDVFSMADCFDFAIYSEGEMPLKEVCARMRDLGIGDSLSLTPALAGVQNVIYRDVDGRVIKNSERPFLAELDSLPSVDYDMVDIRRYSIPTMRGRYVISMMLSRGCPFKCTFCDAPLTMGRKLRFWSMDRIMKDIRFNVEKYGCRNFVFKDSTFTANKKWADQFCDRLIQEGLNIKWRCNTRVNLVPPPLLEKMARAGCYVINFGVESGDPRILKRIQKEVSIDAIYDAHKRCRELGIRTYATFLVGNPGETDESVKRTIEVACGIKPNLAMFFVSTAYPGTPMYDEAVAEGLVEPRWWASQAFDPTKNSEFQYRWGWTAKGALKIPGFDSEYWQRKATRTFYLRPYFVYDTLRFTATNPYFIKHLFSLGKELLPIYKLSNLFKRSSNGRDPEAMGRITARCPSAPTVEYTKRHDVPPPTPVAPPASNAQVVPLFVRSEDGRLAERRPH